MRTRQFNDADYVSPPIQVAKYKRVVTNFPNPGDRTWLPDTSYSVSRHNPVGQSSLLTDVLSTGDFTFNVCDHQKVNKHTHKGNFGFDDFEPSTIMTQPDQAGDYFGAEVWIDNAIQVEIKPQLDPVASTIPIEAFEPLFRLSVLPSTVLIDRDIFDSQFSVWYVIADLFDIKKLLLALITKGALKLPHKKLYLSRTRDRVIPGRGKRQKKPRKSGIPKSDVAKKLADNHLLVQFGILPTVRDLQDFLKVINNFRKVYNDMATFVGQRFRRRLPPVDLSAFFPDSVQEIDFSMSDLSGIDGHCKVTITNEAVWHGTVLYGFSCPAFQGWAARLKQICDSFGIFDPEALWDRIPFSFVLDWFYGVSAWLHTNRPRFFPASVVIHDYCESIRVKTTVKYSVSYWKFENTTTASHYVSNEDWGSEEYITYGRRRFRIDPSNVSLSLPSIKKSFVSIKRILVSASLIAQRLPR
jgi:hypothetical protein